MPNPNSLEVRRWKATGRKFPLVTQSLDIKSAASTGIGSSVRTNENIDPVSLKYACADLLDPNYTWGSMFFSYPYLSSFKCRSYKLSCGIWTQAAQNI